MGPLAGPVVAAAVILPPGTRIRGTRDSKLLCENHRIALASEIRQRAIAFGVGVVTVEEITRLNIYQAGLLSRKPTMAPGQPRGR